MKMLRLAFFCNQSRAEGCSWACTSVCSQSYRSTVQKKKARGGGKWGEESVEPVVIKPMPGTNYRPTNFNSANGLLFQVGRCLAK